MDNEVLAKNLLELVKHHQAKCDGRCNISLMLIKPVYERLVDRKCTEKELKYFG